MLIIHPTKVKQTNLNNTGCAATRYLYLLMLCLANSNSRWFEKLSDEHEFIPNAFKNTLNPNFHFFLQRLTILDHLNNFNNFHTFHNFYMWTISLEISLT